MFKRVVFMNLSICTSGRNAVGDSYKDITNNIMNPEDYVIVVPEGYRKEEFGKPFRKVLLDNFTHSKFRILNAVLYAFKLRKLIISEKIERILLYFDNQWFVPIFSCFLIGLDIKIIAWIHDPILHIGVNRREKLYRYLNSLLLFKRITRFIVSYNEGVDILANEYGIPYSKIRCIYLPEMLSMEFPDIAESKESIKYDFIFWGRIEAYKGIERIIDFAKAMPDKKFLIIGRGKCEDMIKEKCLHLDNICFKNEYVADYDLAKYIKESRYVLLPYIATTGSQTVSIANYYGKPVIASNTGCFKDYITDRVNGLKLSFAKDEDTISIIRNLDNIHFDDKLIRRYCNEKFSIHSIVSNIVGMM